MEFTVMFLQMWSTITGMECNFESYRPEIYHEEAFKKDGFVQPYGDSPLDGETVGEHVYLNIISQAKKISLYFYPVSDSGQRDADRSLHGGKARSRCADCNAGHPG